MTGPAEGDRDVLGVLVGYARETAGGLSLDGQLRALAEANCASVFSDVPVGRTARRPGLEACLAALRPGDTLVVPSLGRLTFSVHELIGLMDHLRLHGVHLRSLDGAMDTTLPDGRAVLETFGALARYVFEADAEAARAGRLTARAAGQRLGRPPSLTPEQVSEARRLLRDAEATIASVARALGVGRSTLYRHLPELTGRKSGD